MTRVYSKHPGTTIGTVVSRLLFRKTPISPLLENICIRIGNKSKTVNCQQNIQQNDSKLTKYYLLVKRTSFEIVHYITSILLWSIHGTWSKQKRSRTEVSTFVSIILSNVIWVFPFFPYIEVEMKTFILLPSVLLISISCNSRSARLVQSLKGKNFKFQKWLH